MRRFILRVFFLWALIFADRSQPAKFAKIRTRKIFMLHGISTNLTANTADFFFRIHKRVRIHYVYGNPIHKRLHRSINSRKFICGNKVFPFDSRFKLSGHTSVVANKYAAFGSSCLFTESAISWNHIQKNHISNWLSFQNSHCLWEWVLHIHCKNAS